MKPLFNQVTRTCSLAPILSMEQVHAGIAAADPSGTQTALPNMTRAFALQALCNEQHRAPTDDEVAAIYDFLPYNPADARHRAAAAAVARHRATDARRAAGQVEDAPAPKATRTYSFADIVAQIDGAAGLKNQGLEPGANGTLRKFAADPARAAVLACKLMGGTVAPTADEIEKCLAPAQFLRTPAGDFQIPRGDT